MPRAKRLKTSFLYSYLAYSNVSQRKADNKANAEAPHDEQTNNRVSFCHILPFSLSLSPYRLSPPLVLVLIVLCRHCSLSVRPQRLPREVELFLRILLQLFPSPL